MLENDTILKLKRSHSDVDHLIPMGDFTPPHSPAQDAQNPTRGSRSFSWSKLTESIKGKGPSSRSSRTSSVDKRPSISSPILDPTNPLCPPTPLNSPEYTSPTPSLSRLPTAQSSLGLRATDNEINDTNTKHAHSSSDPTENWPPTNRLALPDRVPPPIPPTHSFASTLDSPLESITESNLEQDRTNTTVTSPDLKEWLAKMDLSQLEPALLQPPNGGTKFRAMQEAKQMQELVAERAKRAGDTEPPPYDFIELIGKGAYGRVYKGKNRIHGGLVAIKIIDIDNQDYQEMTTENLAQTIKEIDILQQLRDSRARPYVNIIEEARTVHNELWIVSEYASGGSVNTLMKPSHAIKEPGPGLPEKFIIPIARELALGLKYVHEAGVLHRDLKTNNVLILEDGRVQLCDFGVSGTLEPQKSKRSTIVGTPAWMAPELQTEWVKEADPRNPLKPKDILYGNEIDIWAYGCTIHEMASGFPPHYKINQLELPNAGAPVLEGDHFSQDLKDFLAFVFQPDPANRPTPDQILEHPYIAGSTKLYPTFTLVKLVEEYYRWEHQGGARQSLFNPYGAQAPDPLSSEEEDDDDNDWSFSTTEEFEQVHAPQFADPFAAPGQFAGMNIPPVEDMGRFEQLQARFKEESIVRGQKRLNKLFDTTTTPYRYSMDDREELPSGRPPSDLVLRDFNPGAPNRETVIDLDFSMPMPDEPSIDLGEVPTIRAGRMKSILREMAEEEERDAFNQEDELTKRATRDWKFPGTDEKRDTMAWSFPSGQPAANRKTMEWSFAAEQPATNRKTMEWSFAAEQPPPQPKRETMEWTFAAAQPQKPNRRTVEWTFDAAMAEGNYDKRTSRRRETREWKFAKQEDSRKTQDFSFPMRSPTGSQNGMQGSSPTLGPGFRPSLRHAATMPIAEEDDFPRVSNSPDSPMRTSMIDLDMAMVDDYRPSTSGSDAMHPTSAVNDNPFNLEDQVQLSQNNKRASYHFQSKSEPNQTVPGLLTPQQQDAGGNQAHARGVSSASQVQGYNNTTAMNKQQIPNQSVSSAPQYNQHHRPSQRSQQMMWDGWSHTHAYGLGSDDQSPPMSVTTDTSLEEDDVDDLWESFDRLALARRNQITEEDELGGETESEYPYSYSSDSDFAPQTNGRAFRKSRVSAGPNGRPLLDFPVPRGVDAEVLCNSGINLGGNGGVGVEVGMEELLLKACRELRDGTRAGRDLLRAMRLEEVNIGADDTENNEPRGETNETGTVRMISTGR
jgi:protein-serine/threonine kinase